MDRNDVAVLVQLIEVTSTRGAYDLQHYLLVHDLYRELVGLKADGLADLSADVLRRCALVIDVASKKHAFVLAEYEIIARLYQKLVARLTQLTGEEGRELPQSGAPEAGV